MQITWRDALQKILQPIDAAEMRPYDTRAFSHFDIDRVFFSKPCLFGHALGHPDGQAVAPFLCSGFHRGLPPFPNRRYGVVCYATIPGRVKERCSFVSHVRSTTKEGHPRSSIQAEPPTERAPFSPQCCLVSQRPADQEISGPSVLCPLPVCQGSARPDTAGAGTHQDSLGKESWN